MQLFCPFTDLQAFSHRLSVLPQLNTVAKWIFPACPGHCGAFIHLSGFLQLFCNLSQTILALKFWESLQQSLDDCCISKNVQIFAVHSHKVNIFHKYFLPLSTRGFLFCFFFLKKISTRILLYQNNIIIICTTGWLKSQLSLKQKVESTLRILIVQLFGLAAF